MLYITVIVFLVYAHLLKVSPKKPSVRHYITHIETVVWQARPRVTLELCQGVVGGFPRYTYAGPEKKDPDPMEEVGLSFTLTISTVTL